MRILYAEDEKSLSRAVSEILKMEGYEVDAVYDGAEAAEHLARERYDAAVLDIMMPKMDGIQVLEGMRKREDYTPVLLLTAKSAAEDRIQGLTIGADDYLAKPFEMGELLARIHSMIRRMNDYRLRLVQCGNIALNCDTNELKSGQGSLRLSSRETELLAFFMKNAGAPVAVDRIGERVWKEAPDVSAVKLYLSYLENKLRQIHADISFVRTDSEVVLAGMDCR